MRNGTSTTTILNGVLDGVLPATSPESRKGPGQIVLTTSTTKYQISSRLHALLAQVRLLLS